MWAGRYHSPLGTWNNQFHHGAYVQTSISRPAIVDYDDHGGPLPTHLTGLKWEQPLGTGDQLLKLSWALGAGPQIGKHLEAFDLLRPSIGNRKPYAIVRLAHTNIDDQREFGGFVGYGTLGGKIAPVNGVTQTILGGYLRRESINSRIFAALYYVDNLVEQTPTNIRDTFSAAYVQAEYEWKSNMSLYGRLETSNGTQGDAYLSLLPEFPKDRIVTGINFHIASRQSLKLELSSGWIAAGRIDQVAVQWSGALP